MPEVRGKWAQLLAPGLNLKTFGRWREWPEEYRRYMNVLGSTRAYEEDSALGGLGPLAPKHELGVHVIDEPFGLGLVRYIHKTYGLAIVISKEMRDDDQYGVMMKLAGELGKSSRYTTEVYAHDVFNMGFVTTRYTTRDGKALFSTSHDLEDGSGTAANRPNPDVDLSETSLEEAIGHFETQVDERGMPIMLSPQTLLISPQNRLNAKRLLQSELIPGSTNAGRNDINVLRSEGITPVVSHYLTDPDAWFLLGPASELEIKFYWREQPDTKTWDDDNSDATFHRIRQRHSAGASEWRGAYGSSGA